MLPLLYKDRREEGSTTLRQCQLVQLHLLYVIDAICKEADIPYFLIGGTLLGAMRHDGFIPWDDDLDIGVPSDKYEQLLETLRKNLPQDVSLQSPSDNNYTAIPFAKIRDRYSFYCECRPDVATTDPNGIFLDIFPCEEMPEIGVGGQRFFIRMLSSSWMRARGFRNSSKNYPFRGICYHLIALMLVVVHDLIRGILAFLKLFFPKKSIYFRCECGWMHRYDKSEVYPLSIHKFEDGMFPVPANADKVLEAQYGNWREIPPPEKRPRHARIIDPFHSSSSESGIEHPLAK